MPPFRIGQIDHVVLRARDAERAVRFYCEVLGCREERRVEALGLVQLRAGASLIDVIGVDSPLGKPGGAPPGEEGRNLEHLCLGIEPFDEPALRAHLLAHGVEASEVAVRYGAGGPGPSLYIRDPDGNVVELKGKGAPGAPEPG